MTRRYRVTHRTAYRYGMTVSDAYTVTCLLPRQRLGQRVVETSLVADPQPDEYDARLDVFGNNVVQLGVHRPHDRFEVVAHSVVEVDDLPHPASPVTCAEAATLASSLVGQAAIRVGPYRALTAASTPLGRRDLLDELAAEVFVPDRALTDAVTALSSTIFERFTFDASATDVATPLDLVLEERRGVCQDFAHLGVAVCRSVGLPAAYVSGYIQTDPPPGEAKLVGADASHAWCTVWIPSLDDDPAAGHAPGTGNWFDIDPTNDQAPPQRHVTVGWGRDYADVAPVRGVVIGPTSAQTMEVAVDMIELDA